MSTRLLARAWPLRMPAAPKAVLLSCADEASDDGLLPWPSMAALRLRTGLTVHDVRSAFGWLEQSGLLRRTFNRDDGSDTPEWLHLLPSEPTQRTAKTVPCRRGRRVAR